MHTGWSPSFDPSHRNSSEGSNAVKMMQPHREMKEMKLMKEMRKLEKISAHVARRETKRLNNALEPDRFS